MEKTIDPDATFSNKKYLEGAVERLLGETKKEEIISIPVDKIVPNPFQPRRYFNKEKLEELAQSIKEKGVQEPIIVRKATTAESPFPFELIAGERRWRASIIVNNSTIPAVIRDFSDNDLREISLLENLQREDLTYFETMLAIKGLKDVYGDNEGISNKIGLSKRSIEQYLKTYNDISSVPELFAVIEKKQAGLAGVFLKVAAEIAQELKRLKKSDKQKFDRFFRKVANKGIEKAAKDLHLRITNNAKREISGSPEGDRPFANILKETEDRLALNVAIAKSKGITQEEYGLIKTAVESFVNKTGDLLKRDQGTSVESMI